MSNGFVEGENNRIKVIKCMAYGYRDLNNLRRRIFLSSNEMTANIKVSGGFHTYWRRARLQRSVIMDDALLLNILLWNS